MYREWTRVPSDPLRSAPVVIVPSLRKVNKQESIPVGCVPSAAVAVCCRGCLPEGCLPVGCAAGGCLLGGVCLGGMCIPACTETDTPTVNRMTDRQVQKHYLSATSFVEGNKPPSPYPSSRLNATSFWNKGRRHVQGNVIL